MEETEPGKGNGAQGDGGENVVIFEDEVVVTVRSGVVASGSSLNVSQAPPLDTSDIEPTPNRIN